MKIPILIITILIITAMATTNAFSVTDADSTVNIMQLPEFPSDSAWNLKSLDSLLSLMPVEPPMTYSKGWFPKPVLTTLWLGYEGVTADTYDYLKALPPNIFVDDKREFSGFNKYKSDQRKVVLDKNTIGRFKSEYPNADYSAFLLNLKYSIKYYPLVFHAGLGVAHSKGLLSSLERKQYLGALGEPVNFKEVNFIFLDEWLISSRIGAIIPIYGAFINTDNSMDSYYYFSAGLKNDYSVYSNATQYLQIMDAKMQLRYPNGLDTINFFSGKTLPGLNRSRFSLDLALGWDFNIQNGGIKFQVSYSVPFTSVVKNGDWKQGTLGIGFTYSLFEFLNKNDILPISKKPKP